MNPQAGGHTGPQSAIALECRQPDWSEQSSRYKEILLPEKQNDRVVHVHKFVFEEVACA